MCWTGVVVGGGGRGTPLTSLPTAPSVHEIPPPPIEVPIKGGERNDTPAA